MTPAEAEKLTYTLMEKHQLRGWFFAFTKSTRTFGDCLERGRRIRLSSVLVQLNDYQTVHNVVLHEIAHALAGHKAGHGPKWKQEAIRIGCTGDRCYNSDDVNTPILSYQSVCKVCYRVTNYSRSPISLCSCGYCSKRYDERFILKPFSIQEKLYYPLQAISKSGEIFQTTMRIGTPTVGRIYLTDWLPCTLAENPYRIVVAAKDVPAHLIQQRPEMRGLNLMLPLTERAVMGYEYAKAGNRTLDAS